MAEVFDKNKALLISKTLQAFAAFGLANLCILVILILCLLVFSGALAHLFWLKIFWFAIFTANSFLLIQAWHLYLDAQLFAYLSSENSDLNKLDDLILNLFGRDLKNKSFGERCENTVKKAALFLKYSVFNIMILLVFMAISSYVQFYLNHIS